MATRLPVEIWEHIGRIGGYEVEFQLVKMGLISRQTLLPMLRAPLVVEGPSNMFMDGETWTRATFDFSSGRSMVWRLMMSRKWTYESVYWFSQGGVETKSFDTILNPIVGAETGAGDGKRSAFGMMNL